MNKDILPLFTSHYSFGKSTLTLDKPEEIIDNKPISIFSIAKQYKLDEIYLVEDNFSGFIEAFKNAKDNDIHLKFGLKLVVCNDINDKSDVSFKSESKVIIWMKNSDGYKDLIRIYSKAATDGFYYIPRIDWKLIEEMWTNNLLLSVPSYSSFLHNNLLRGHECIPSFIKMKPTIMFSKMKLPFDSLIEGIYINYAKSNKLEIIEAHPVRFFGPKQLDSYCCFRAINKKGTMSDPKLDHFSSREFNFESYLKK